MAFLTYLFEFGWVPAILLLLGIALIFVEFAIPGFGFPGISGIILIIAGVVLKARSVLEGLLLILAIILITGIGGFLFFRSASKGRLSRSKFVLKAAASRAEGFSSTEEEQTASYVGMAGIAATDLRPAGTAIIDGKKLDVVSESEYIESGSSIKVDRVEGRRIV
ncbi:MAG: hypothetical protein ILP09_02615, partial [Oscillospiraceae bacterium]|nr:hypothetical protein [Oscillospiraceae bacterium]